MTSPVINSEWKMITMALFPSSPEPKERESFSDQNLSIFVAQVCSNELFQMNCYSYSRGGNSNVVKIHLHLLKNHWANFNPVQSKTYLSEGNSSLYK